MLRANNMHVSASGSKLLMSGSSLEGKAFLRFKKPRNSKFKKLSASGKFAAQNPDL